MIIFRQHGSFQNVEKFFNRIRGKEYLNVLNRYGQAGVEALSASTPTDSGMTARSWYYTIDHSGTTTTISWGNSNVHEGANIAILLQYGHGTGTGGYVRGFDYINPAMRPIFEKLAAEVWKEVTSV